ncbi:hypothetical protein [Microbacterium sp. NPDC091662]|uniref:hypothetical protein n=1 Tax=Microbacterium sp. NPDC091662 TaxID=3364211 RepID=UPI00383065D6
MTALTGCASGGSIARDVVADHVEQRIKARLGVNADVDCGNGAVSAKKGVELDCSVRPEDGANNYAALVTILSGTNDSRLSIDVAVNAER